MIKRIWHGWTTHTNADRYESLLKEEIFPCIEAKQVPGYRSIQLLRREHADEVEFITLMEFDSLDAIKAFVGDDVTVSYVPDKARAVLAHWDAHAQHYEVRDQRRY